MTTTLSVDVGQTGSRLRLDDGEVWHSTAGRAGAEPEDALVAAVTEVAARLPQRPPLDTLSAGLTGLQGRPARAAEVLERVAAVWPVRRVVAADDSLTAFVGALGLQSGAVVAAGTGAVALATDGVSRHARVDGWGYLVGDLGSGYWVARRGLEAAFCELDGRGGSPELLRLARETFGDLERFPVLLAADRDRVQRVALFAERVADAAHAGDELAVQIFGEAGKQLASSVAAACTRSGLGGAVAVSWTGRLFDVGPLLAEPFRASLLRRLPDAVLTPAAGDGLDGARGLAELAELPRLEGLLASAARETIGAMGLERS